MGSLRYHLQSVCGETTCVFATPIQRQLLLAHWSPDVVFSTLDVTSDVGALIFAVFEIETIFHFCRSVRLARSQTDRPQGMRCRLGVRAWF